MPDTIFSVDSLSDGMPLRWGVPKRCKECGTRGLRFLGGGSIITDSKEKTALLRRRYQCTNCEHIISIEPHITKETSDA